MSVAKNEPKKVKVKSEKYKKKAKWTNKSCKGNKRGWSGRTCLHVRHTSSVPLRNIGIECICRSECCECVYAILLCDPAKPKTEKSKKEREEKKMVEKKQEYIIKRNGVDVLPYILVTLAVVHFERSALNANEFQNAEMIAYICTKAKEEKW